MRVNFLASVFSKTSNHMLLIHREVYTMKEAGWFKAFVAVTFCFQIWFVSNQNLKSYSSMVLHASASHLYRGEKMSTLPVVVLDLPAMVHRKKNLK